VEARYSLTLYEQRLVLIMISMIEPSDEDFKDYVLKVSDFRDLLGLKNKNLYSQIKLVLKKLIERSLFIPLEDKSYLMSNWISDAEYKSNEGVVLLSLSKKLKPYLLHLRNNFTKQRLNMVIQFNGFYTIRIYTLLKQYEKIGKRVFDVEEFKLILGIEKNKYTLFANLKARTIMQAKKEFDKKDKSDCFLSDINFNLEAIKTGRKITHLKFIIIKQDVAKREKIAIPTISKKECDNTPSILLEYKNIGVMPIKTKLFYQQRGEESLINTLQYFKQQIANGKDVQDKGAYLFALLKANAGQTIEVGHKHTAKKEANSQTKQLKVPMIRNGSQLQEWAVANGLPVAPVGFDTTQYYRMLCNHVERVNSAEERAKEERER
jgi:plasmid replication initiation protein